MRVGISILTFEWEILYNVPLERCVRCVHDIGEVLAHRGGVLAEVCRGRTVLVVDARGWWVGPGPEPQDGTKSGMGPWQSRQCQENIWLGDYKCLVIVFALSRDRLFKFGDVCRVVCTRLAPPFGGVSQVVWIRLASVVGVVCLCKGIESDLE